MTITDQLVEHAAAVSGLDADDLYVRLPARTDRHARVRYTAEEISEFHAEGDRLSAGYCADPACGRFMTSPIHFQPGEAEYVAGPPLDQTVIAVETAR